MNDQIRMIADLSDAFGAPGFEDEVIEKVRGYAEGLGEIREDHMRNLYIHRSGNTGDRPVVQLDGHSDEVAFMVQAIKPNGMLRFVALGGWVPANVAAHRVWVLSDCGKWLPGIIASNPPHFMSEAERKAPPALESMVIDLGVTSREETLALGISIGAPVVPDVTFEYWEEQGLLQGKAFDNRLGCCAVIEALRRLQHEDLAVDLVGTISAQEEVGCRGAEVTAQVVEPDVAIVFEGCPADDTFTEGYMIQTALKKGPMLRHVDKRMITNPRFQKLALQTAKECGIPTQTAVRTGGGTDGAPIHLAEKAVPCIVMGIPVRYAHTHYCLSALSDFEHSVQLAVEIIRKLNAEVIAKL